MRQIKRDQSCLGGQCSVGENGLRGFRVTLGRRIRDDPRLVAIIEAVTIVLHTYILNSAHLVQFPILSPSPCTWPMGASEKPPPMAPPIMLKPLRCPTRSGNTANSRATFVNAPVATSQAVFAGCASNAAHMASMAGTSLMGEEAASGSSSVPSKPVVPNTSCDAQSSKPRLEKISSFQAVLSSGKHKHLP